MANPKDFTPQWISKYTKDYDKFLVDLTRVQTLEVWRELTVITPFDTGRARAGWIATTGQPSNSTPPPAGDGQILSVTPPQINNTKVGVKNWVVNNVEYIIPLADGHSIQQPKGWVQKAIARSVASVNKQTSRLIAKYKL